MRQRGGEGSGERGGRPGEFLVEAWVRWFAVLDFLVFPVLLFGRAAGEAARPTLARPTLARFMLARLMLALSIPARPTLDVMSRASRMKSKRSLSP